MKHSTHDESVFPKDFLWGASTAAHQVEGKTYNQWTVWELAHAKELATTARKRLEWMPNWDAIRPQATTPDNYLSGVGVQHYSRYKHDFDIAQKLHLNSFRFGVEWSRIEPEQGAWNIEAIEHYKGYIEELLTRGIEPVLNLWHWTMPVWFTDMGGFEKRSNIQYFERFVQKLCDELPIDKLKYVLTLNEPGVYSSFGYQTGEWPPNKKSPLTFIRVYYNLSVAHKKTYKILKKRSPDLNIGVAKQLVNVQPKRVDSTLDMLAVRIARYGINWWFMGRIRKHQDFIGVNYYFTSYLQWSRLTDMRAKGVVHEANPKQPLNDLGWYMEPEGIHPLLVSVWQRYKKPILITENGLADRGDVHRKWWIDETMIAMQRSLSDGVDLIGYQHWSLLDNFEWAYGWWPKFGLVEVDRKTMKRTVRPSAKRYADHIERVSRQ